MRLSWHREGWTTRRNGQINRSWRKQIELPPSFFMSSRKWDLNNKTGSCSSLNLLSSANPLSFVNSFFSVNPLSSVNRPSAPLISLLLIHWQQRVAWQKENRLTEESKLHSPIAYRCGFLRRLVVVNGLGFEGLRMWKWELNGPVVLLWTGRQVDRCVLSSSWIHAASSDTMVCWGVRC
jgi:hypothetical protein